VVSFYDHDSGHVTSSRAYNAKLDLKTTFLSQPIHLNNIWTNPQWLIPLTTYFSK